MLVGSFKGDARSSEEPEQLQKRVAYTLHVGVQHMESHQRKENADCKAERL